ncbi:MAG: hypothetical protein KDD50_00595, partial [Bdellovibrionales bacterium]|nr:hypothetical protein [Bdellovibrionales bacterium]
MTDNFSHKELIVEFVNASEGLSIEEVMPDGQITIHQTEDSNKIVINEFKIEKVLVRKDSEGKTFLQVNFDNNEKILLTSRLVGFKPSPKFGLQMKKLPKIVTTPDLLNV